MIRLKDISKTFYTDKGQVEAVKKVNLHIKRGEIHGIIGHSGAGKSTLIRCVNLLEMPTAGEVIINGKNLTTLSIAKLRQERRKIGMIFQGFNLLKTATVYDNIALPLKLAGFKGTEIKRQVEKYIEIVGLGDRKSAYPAQLSGGQKQRVAIARALAQEPEILLSDEATSALDPETTTSILDLLLTINKELGITILLITHEMEVIQRICDSVSVMEAGEIIEQNHTTNIFIHPKHPTTKKFLQTFDEDQLDAFLSADIASSGRIFQLNFIGQSTGEPVLATLIKKYSVEPNIIHANFLKLKNDVIGSLIVHIDGKDREIKEAILYLEERNIFVNELGDQL